MPKLSQKPLERREIPSLSILSAECTPASIGNSVTADIHFRSATITVLIITSKMGWLTFPISGYQHYGFSHTTRIASSRNSWISLIPRYYQNPFTLRISGRPVSNLHSTPTSRTNGRLWKQGIWTDGLHVLLDQHHPSLFDSQHEHLPRWQTRPQITPQKQILEDHHDQSSLSMTRWPHRRPLRHHHQDRHSRSDEGLCTPNARAVMFDACDKQLRIWDLRVWKGGNVMIFYYLILSQWTTFSFQHSILGYALSPPLLHPSIIFPCHSALHHPCVPDIVTHSICDSFRLLL